MEIVQDVRYAARALRRQPAFAVVAVFTLAVGIGANTAIYSVVDATIVRPLPFHNPARLMSVSLTMPPKWGRPADDQMIWSYPKYETFRQTQQVFETMALYRSGTVNLTGGGGRGTPSLGDRRSRLFPLVGRPGRTRAHIPA